MAGRKRKAQEGAPLSHAHIMNAAITPDPELQRRSQLLWEDRSRGSRGPKASFTPDEVVEAAIEIADEEGSLAAVTMQALSTRLGLTTMAVYRYFPNKEALYDAIIDAGKGLPPDPKDPPEPWRVEITAWAKAKRAMMISRPWLAELPFVAAPHGPNWMMWREALARPLARAGFSGELLGQMLSIVDQFTRGASDTSISLARAKARGISEQQWAAAIGADLGRTISDPRFPVFASIITAPRDGRGRNLEESFEFGLERVLDGIELYLNTRFGR